ncbi:MAG: glycosyltransferase family 2 protein [Prevotellamassilia sp.]
MDKTDERQMKSRLFSLILPAYKVEQYIGKCVESCCEQHGVSPTDYEVIVVDDGSPDRSAAVVTEVAKRYPNHSVRVVTRENGGLSAARNTGLQEAVGEYIWFIDSDDYIEPHALSSLMKWAQQREYDIINFTHYTHYKNGRKVGGDIPNEGASLGDAYLATHSFLSAWTCIYRHSFLRQHQLTFKEGVLWEDSEFNIRAYLLTDKCYTLGVALYNYIRRENSISDICATSYSTESKLKNIIGLDEFFSSRGLEKQQKRILYSRLADLLVMTIAGLPELSVDQRKHYRKEIRALGVLYFKMIRLCGNLKYTVALLFNYLLPKQAEVLLNKKTHEAIRRSTQ